MIARRDRTQTRLDQSFRIGVEYQYTLSRFLADLDNFLDVIRDPTAAL